MKEHGPEWKYLVVLEEREKGSPKVVLLIRSHFKIREFQEF